ncbi:MAG: glycoside hydrolase family 113 [Bradymonadia bacterium]
MAGIAFTPHREYPNKGIVFRPLIDDLATTGATHLSMVVQWSQDDVASERIFPHDVHTQKDAEVRSLVRYAQQRGLKVMLFPIVWVEQRAIGDWRGTLRPTDLDAWWASYERFIWHYADMAAELGVEAFSVGSELGAMEHDRPRWLKLIAGVKGRFKGKLLYSANWDHYAYVTFWDQVDYVGMTAYHELTDRNDADQATLDAAWVKIRDQLLAWQSRVGKPLVITEVGYPSQDGGAKWPWNYTLDGPLDHAEQRMAYEAFVKAWQGQKALGGVFFWNWFGLGGPTCGDYTPRGKPAEEVIRRWYGGSAKLDARAPAE